MDKKVELKKFDKDGFYHLFQKNWKIWKNNLGLQEFSCEFVILYRNKLIKLNEIY